MMTLWQDLRYGLRMLRKSPGFTLVAVLALALGIGVNTAIFSGVSAFVLRPLPGVGDPAQVVTLYEQTRADGETYTEFSYPDFVDFREQSGDVLEGMAAHDMVQAALGEGGERDGEVVWGQLVTDNLFDVLRVKMHLGRGFLPEEDATPNTHAVVVLSHALWQNRFGADDSIIDKTVNLNGKPYTVVGVSEREFTGAKWALGMQFFVPMMMREQLAGSSRDWYKQRGNHYFDSIARLKDGVTAAQASAALSNVSRRLEEQYPDARPKGAEMVVVPEPEGRWEDMAGVVRLSSAMALGVVGLILLIACANVANLLLARAVSRRREIGIRLALGASRARIVRQLLTESILLSLIGGGLGLLLAYWITDMMTTFFPVIAYTITLELSPDTRALWFTLAVSLLTGLVFGLVPALQASRPDVVPVLKGETPQPRGRVRRFGLRGALVVSQVALSLVVLVCAAMFVKSFRNAKTIDPGFATENVLTASLNPGLMGYEREQGKEFYRQLVERVEGLPGVESAGLVNWLPLGDSSSTWGPIYRADQPVPEPGSGLDTHVASVSPGLFEAMEISLVSGRDFEERDRAGVLPEAVILNETLARRLWPNEEAVGKQLKIGRTEPETLEVVGVVRDAKYRSLGEQPRNHIYVSLEQTYRAAMSVVVRTKGDPASMTPALRGAVKTLDPRMPLYNVKTMEQHMTWALWAQNMAASLSMAFGLLALVLAATGLYSVIAYSVSQRTREIGIRMALGAQPGDVLRMIARQGLTLTLVGLAFGLGGALVMTRVVASLLYGVGTTDLTIFVGVPLALAAVALLATYIPARRATKVDPMVALRYE
ncbi:MAG TPA: ABC transporter permease [Pyrinomonadaceae bacterium]|nr:ABC transporter permease [Pyrinomonadaceae bacterium]